MFVFEFLWFALIAAATAVVAISPPKSPPKELLPKYSLDGSIPIEYFYVDDTMDGEATHFSFLAKSMENYLKAANNSLRKIEDMINHPLRRGSLDDLTFRLAKEQWLYLSLFMPIDETTRYFDTIRSAHPRVLVVGSMSPWVESLFLAVGASEVVTVEYNKLTYEHPRVKTVSGAELEAFYSCDGSNIGSFDYIVSMSSLDHDGLGRYGDRLNPEGDLESMALLRSLLKPNGVLIITVPIGPDVVVFNLHRRYGRIRLEKLLQGWKILNRLGWREEMLDRPANWRQTYEPVLYLGVDTSTVDSRCPQPHVDQEL